MYCYIRTLPYLVSSFKTSNNAYARGAGQEHNPYKHRFDGGIGYVGPFLSRHPPYGGNGY